MKTHLLRAFAKLGVDDRTHAVTVAMHRGLLGGEQTGCESARRVGLRHAVPRVIAITATKDRNAASGSPVAMVIVRSPTCSTPRTHRRLLGHVGRQQVDLQQTPEGHRPAHRERQFRHGSPLAPSRTRSRATSGMQALGRLPGQLSA